MSSKMSRNPGKDRISRAGHGPLSPAPADSREFERKAIGGGGGGVVTHTKSSAPLPLASLTSCCMICTLLKNWVSPEDRAALRGRRVRAKRRGGKEREGQGCPVGLGGEEPGQSRDRHTRRLLVMAAGGIAHKVTFYFPNCFLQIALRRASVCPMIRRYSAQRSRQGERCWAPGPPSSQGDTEGQPTEISWRSADGRSKETAGGA